MESTGGPRPAMRAKRLAPGAAGCEDRHSELTREVRRHGGGQAGCRAARRGVQRSRAGAEPWTEDAEFVAPGASMSGGRKCWRSWARSGRHFPTGVSSFRGLRRGLGRRAEGRFVGTHSGVLPTPTGEVPATGRLVDFRWMSAYEARGDKLASEHLFSDQVELLTSSASATLRAALDDRAGRCSASLIT